MGSTNQHCSVEQTPTKQHHRHTLANVVGLNVCMDVAHVVGVLQCTDDLHHDLTRAHSAELW
jgi:hypothetical protein